MNYICKLHWNQPHQRHILVNLPEHVVDDIMESFLFISKTEPSHLCGRPLDNLLSLVVFFLQRPWAVKSPHLRAKFGQLLYFVFLPASCLENEHGWSNNWQATDGPNRHLLATHAAARSCLAPALLLLYGDVEKTGFYEKMENRKTILKVLQHVWALPSHREAFRSIATDCNDGSAIDLAESYAAGEFSATEASTGYFIVFANGLLNETNKLVSETIEKLQEIKKIQVCPHCPFLLV